MSNKDDNAWGERIKSERERLKLSQAALAEKIRVSRTTQVNYETGRRPPGAKYLHAFGELGADVGYVIFGERSNPSNLYGLGAARVLPLVAERAGINSDALFGILSLAAEDEANALGSATSALIPEDTLRQLVTALFHEHGKLLGQAFLSIAQVLHDMKAELPAARRAAVVLALHQDFKELGRAEKRIVKTAVKVATFGIASPVRDRRRRKQVR